MKHRDARWPQPIHAHGLRKQARFALDRDTHTHISAYTLPPLPPPACTHRVWRDISNGPFCLFTSASLIPLPEFENFRNVEPRALPRSSISPSPPHTHTKPLCPVKEIVFKELNGRSPDPLAVLSQPFPHPLLFPNRPATFHHRWLPPSPEVLLDGNCS